MARSMLLILLLFFSCNLNTDQIWTEEDRALLLEELNDSRNVLIEFCSPLSNDQWVFKTDSTKWSIAEIVEHVGLQQDMHFREVYVISQQPVYSVPETVLENDQEVIGYEFDPNKGIAGFYVQPLNRWNSKAATLKQFSDSRNEIIKFVENTSTDLRKHFTYRNQLNSSDYRRKRDLHQILLTTATHTRRHTLQIEAIKSDANFPK